MRLKNKVRKLEDELAILRNVTESVHNVDVIMEDFANRISVLKNQLKCAAKGHKMVFEKVVKRGSEPVWILLPSNGFYFKCSNCGLEIIKTKAELTTTEKDALKKLKLLQEKK